MSSKVKNLIFIKHSLPEMIPSVPANKWNLSKIGRMRCKALAGKIKIYLPDIVVSSLEPKAIETAKLVAQHVN